MTVQIAAIVLSFITFLSSCILLFAAVRLWPEKGNWYALVLFVAMTFLGLFFMFPVAGSMLYGATLGTLSLKLPTPAGVGTLILYLLMHLSIDLLALVVAGVVKPKGNA